MSDSSLQSKEYCVVGPCRTTRAVFGPPPCLALIANWNKKLFVAITAPEHRPLQMALLISLLLHLLPFIAGWLDFSSPGKALQTILQVSLTPAPVTNSEANPHSGPQQKPRARPQPDPEPPKIRKVLSAKSAESLPALDEKTISANPATLPEVVEQPDRPDSGAVALQDAGTPTYPDEALRRGLESCVLAAIQVSAGGEVTSVKILHADVPGVFDQSMIDAHSAVTYLPALRNGQPVASRVLAVAEFVLQAGHLRRCALKYASAGRKINALPAQAEIDANMAGALLNGQP